MSWYIKANTEWGFIAKSPVSPNHSALNQTLAYRAYVVTDVSDVSDVSDVVRCVQCCPMCDVGQISPPVRSPAEVGSDLMQCYSNILIISVPLRCYIPIP